MRAIEEKIVASCRWEEELLERRKWINHRLREERARRRKLLDRIPDKKGARRGKTAGEVAGTRDGRSVAHSTIGSKGGEA